MLQITSGLLCNQSHSLENGVLTKFNTAAPLTRWLADLLTRGAPAASIGLIRFPHLKRGGRKVAAP